jgi:hypothetical protein
MPKTARQYTLAIKYITKKQLVMLFHKYNSGIAVPNIQKNQLRIEYTILQFVLKA